MKRTYILISILFCSQIIFSQSINKVITDEKGNQKMLGIINEKGLKQAPFNVWFDTNYDDYLVNDKIIKKLKDSLNQYTIKVFLGTWCGDSKKEVPQFYSILDAIKFPESQLEIIAVDNTEDAYKQAPNHEEKGSNIHRVPTFIFYKDRKEVNRIVEHPKETLERDMLNIVNGKRYTPNYPAANFLQNQLATITLDSLKRDENRLVSMLSEYVKGSRELNTVGYVYLRANEIDNAMYIFELNTKIFPYKYNVYDSLGEAYYKTENYEDAVKNYYKVLSLKPDDENALEMIEKIKLFQDKQKS